MLLTLSYLAFVNEIKQSLFYIYYYKALTVALGSTQPTIQKVPGAPSSGIKRSVCEDDHSSPSDPEISNAWSYAFTPPCALMGCMWRT